MRSSTSDTLIGTIMTSQYIRIVADNARFITTPLLLLDLLLTAGLPWPTILYTILMDEIMIVTGLVGALVKSNYKVNTVSIVNARHANLLCSGDTMFLAALPSSSLHGTSLGLPASMPQL